MCMQVFDANLFVLLLNLRLVLLLTQGYQATEIALTWHQPKSRSPDANDAGHIEAISLKTVNLASNQKSMGQLIQIHANLNSCILIFLNHRYIVNIILQKSSVCKCSRGASMR